MEDIQLLVNMFQRVERQGPGSRALTARLLETYIAPLIKSHSSDIPFQIADLGCGSGLSTLQLAALPSTHISAVDLMPEFLSILNDQVSQNLLTNITAHQASMDQLPFESESFDAIWSEGAIYNIGFENGINYWRNFLKPQGLLLLTEITWLTQNRPEEIHEYWATQYPEIDTASSKLALLENNGYTPLEYTVLPPSVWQDFYLMLENIYDEFLKDQQHSTPATMLVQAMREEAQMYDTYKDHYSYGVYVAQKQS